MDSLPRAPKFDLVERLRAGGPGVAPGLLLRRRMCWCQALAQIAAHSGGQCMPETPNPDSPLQDILQLIRPSGRVPMLNSHPSSIESVLSCP